MTAGTDDPYDLQRFVAAQDSGDTYAHALAELKRGRKTSHWMWFVFPQIAGLGHSAMAVRYAIGSLDEAIAYLAHPVLGAAAPRVRRCPERDLESERGGDPRIDRRAEAPLVAHALPPGCAGRAALSHGAG